jgi:hypothetical protein
MNSAVVQMNKSSNGFYMKLQDNGKTLIYNQKIPVRAILRGSDRTFYYKWGSFFSVNKRMNISYYVGEDTYATRMAHNTHRCLILIDSFILNRVKINIPIGYYLAGVIDDNLTVRILTTKSPHDAMIKQVESMELNRYPKLVRADFIR